MRPALGALALLLTVPLAGALSGSAHPLGAHSASGAQPGGSPDGRGLHWQEQVVDSGQSFRGLDAVDRRTAWVSGGSTTAGGDGAVLRTTDAGATWQDVSPATGEGLMFRDVEARSADTAVVLAIGPGEASRIYRTDDGGSTWAEAFRNAEPSAFYNCMDFFPGGRRGLAVSDPVDGRFRIAATSDGGRTWEVLPSTGMPVSDGEYNFSASGDCLVTAGRHAWFGSGGSAARVFHSTDRGLSWTAHDSTLRPGEAAGVFALAFRDPRHGLAVGGDFAAPDDGTDASALTSDGTAWRDAGDLPHLGEDASWLRRAPRTVLVVGESGPTGGSSVSHDGGHTWEQFSESGFHTLDCTPDGSCWAAGGGGRVGLL